MRLEEDVKSCFRNTITAFKPRAPVVMLDKVHHSDPEKELARKVAEYFGNAESSGDGYMSNCPGEDHDDNKASFWIAPNNHQDGPPLVLFCHAGCDKQHLQKKLNDAIGALGLNLASVKRRKKIKPSDFYLKNLYHYCYENGNYAFTKARYINPLNGEKDFRAGFMNKRGNFNVASIKEVKNKPLYHLPELVKATPDEYVFIVEGEKDAETLAEAGQIAVCNHNGAGERGDKWEGRYNRYFEGLKVTILPDNDRAGRKHANNIKKSLDDLAASVEIVELPNLPEKGDVSDWLAEIGTIDQLIDLLGGGKLDEFELPWRDRLLMTGARNPVPKKCEFNVMTAINYHPELKNRIAFDSFTKKFTILEILPWKKAFLEWVDSDALQLTAFLQAEGLPCDLTLVKRCLAQLVDINKIDSLHQKLESLPDWDGVNRLSTWLLDYCGAEGENGYLAGVGTRWMISAVARGYAVETDVKVDELIVLEGPQGIKKSWLGCALALQPSWFHDQLSDKLDNEDKRSLQGKQIVELAELTAVKKGDVDKLKAFFTIRSDSIRPLYKDMYVDFPRRCVFIGTHNPSMGGYLRDPTGARRYLPVVVTRIDIDAVEQEKEQLWAEAVHRYKAGERWWSEEGDPGVRLEQQKRYRKSDLFEDVLHYLTHQPIRDRDIKTGEIAVTWEERKEPLGVFVPKLFWLELFGKQVNVSAPQGPNWKDRNDVEGSLQVLRWTKAESRNSNSPKLPPRWRYVLKERGRDPKERVAHYLPPLDWAPHGDDDDDGNNDQMPPTKGDAGGSSTSSTPATTPPTNAQHETVSGLMGVGGRSKFKKETKENIEEVNNKQIHDIHDCNPVSTPCSLQNLYQLEKFLTQYAHKPIGFDLETTALRPRDGRVRLAQFWRNDDACIIDVDQVGGFSALKPFLDGTHLVAFNAQFELAWLRDARIEVKRLDDAKLAYAAIYGGTTSLAKAADRFLGIQLDKQMQKSDWSGDLTQEQVDYATKDAEVALKLWQNFVPRIEEQDLAFGYELLREAMAPISMMQESGMYFDREAHAKLVTKLTRGQALASNWLTKQIPEILNWNSPIQIQAWIREKLDRKSRSQWPRTGTNKLSVSAPAIKEAFAKKIVPKELVRILSVYLVRQNRTTYLKTFGESLAQKVGADGRVHGDIQISGAVTGRMSSSNPNLQNFPNGKKFRSLFIAEPGYQIVVCDYSQIEVRVGGLLANEPVLASIFEEGYDVHTASAAMMFRKDQSAVTTEERKQAKTLTFGMQYGMGDKSIAKTLDVSLIEAQAVIRKWKATYPKMADWRDQSDKDGRKYKELYTAGGRRIELNDNPSTSVCYNYPVQGSAADVMYRALSLLRERVSQQHPTWKLLAVVHDEVVMEVPDSDVDESKKLLEQCMVLGFTDIFEGANIAGLVDASSGDSWAAK